MHAVHVKFSGSPSSFSLRDLQSRLSRTEWWISFTGEEKKIEGGVNRNGTKRRKKCVTEEYRSEGSKKKKAVSKSTQFQSCPDREGREVGSPELSGRPFIPTEGRSRSVLRILFPDRRLETHPEIKACEGILHVTRVSDYYTQRIFMSKGRIIIYPNHRTFGTSLPALPFSLAPFFVVFRLWLARYQEWRVGSYEM